MREGPIPLRSRKSRSGKSRAERRNSASNDSTNRPYGARACEVSCNVMTPTIGTLKHWRNDKNDIRLATLFIPEFF